MAARSQMTDRAWSSGGLLAVSAPAVLVQRKGVDHEREAKQVEVLAGVAEAVRSAEPHGVVEMPVD